MERLKKIFRTADIPFLDRYTIEHEPVKSVDLMERAARFFVGNLMKKFPRCRKFMIVAGWGNNGGDGYVIARLLREQEMLVKVARVVASAEMSPDCRINYERWKGETIEINHSGDLMAEEGYVIIDALFGSGLNRPVSGLAGEVIGRMNAFSNAVVAVDIPSGLMGEDNSANDRSMIVKADYTFTFQFPKLAFMLPENAGYVGDWDVIDIRLHPEAMELTATNYFFLTVEAVAQLLPRPSKFSHKGTNGTGLLVAGSYAMMGAAVLAAEAAVHSGIGLLACHVPVKGIDIIQVAVPEALVDPDKNGECFSGVADWKRYNAVAVGPGIGTKEETVAGLKDLLTGWRGPTILDADALNILSENRKLLDLLHDKCILTPHPKEFERLAGKSENDFERLNKLSNFATYYKTIVVLKGAHTVIALPSGRCIFNMTGNPGMAKGGSGDVLTGMLLALVTNGVRPEDAAVIGVFAHGMAGDIAAGENGMRGMSAGSIIPALGKVWKKLEYR